MVLLDSSVLIDYLAGEEAAVEFLADRATDRLLTVRLAAFEVYLGEVYRPGPSDFDELEARLDWLTVTSLRAGDVRRAAELQDRFHERGTPLDSRDAYIVGAADGLNEPLAHRDSDFETEGLAAEIETITVGH